MKLKTTFSDECNDDLDINDCDKWFFWLFISLLIFKEEIKLLTTTLFIIQNNLISKHHFSTCLIAFRNSNIIFKMFVLIFFMKNLDVLRLNNWFNFICIVEKFHIQRSTITFWLQKRLTFSSSSKNVDRNWIILRWIQLKDMTMKRNLYKISIYRFEFLFLIFWKFLHHFANNNKQYTQLFSYLNCCRWFFAKLLKM